MRGFEDIIQLLLAKKESTEAEKTARIAEAVNQIELEFSERSNKIQSMLDECGYVESVIEPHETSTEEPIAEEQSATEHVEAPVEVACETVSVDTNSTQEAQPQW